MTTPLDKVCDKLGGALNQVQHAEANFYDKFLSTELFFVTNGDLEANQIAKAGEEFDVVMVEDEGNSFLMLFDTLERLQSWAQRDVMTLASYGSDILKNFEFNENTYIVLNENTDHWKEFTPEEIAWLKENIVEEK